MNPDRAERIEPLFPRALPWIIATGCAATVLTLAVYGWFTSNWWPLILGVGVIGLIGIVWEHLWARGRVS